MSTENSVDWTATDMKKFSPDCAAHLLLLKVVKFSVTVEFVDCGSSHSA